MTDMNTRPDPAVTLNLATISKPKLIPLERFTEVLVALANAKGGTLVFGVDPRDHSLLGLDEPEEALDRALQAALAVDPPLIIPLPQINEIDGKWVLIMTVPPGLPHVYSYKGRYLIYEGNQIQALSPSQLRRLMMERGAISFETQTPGNAQLHDLDWNKIERYLTSLYGLPAARPEEILLGRGCVVQTDDGQLRPTYAGLLLFGIEPQRWVHSARILVARYTGTSPSDHFMKEEIQGTLPEQIRRAEAFIVANMRRGVQLLGLERVEETEYPVDAVREAIVNAVAHRDYQIRGDEIRILMFTDRIEFYSPGRLPGPMTLKNLIEERFSRNEVIVQILSDMGFIERLGYGIDRMIRIMNEASLPAPRFEETAAGFQVTLYRSSATLAGEEIDSRQWRGMGLNERQERALAYLAEKGRITNSEYQELCPDVSPETIRRDLADLVRRNLLLKIGDKRATYYIFK